MDLLFPDQGLVEQLKRVLNGTVRYHLFTNNLTPDLNTVIGDLTEAAWAGYASVTKDFTDFTLNGVSGHGGFAIAAPINYANSSGSSQSTYGYYVTDAANTMLLAVARFDSPPVVVADGGNVTVVPVWGDFSQLAS